MKVFTAGLALLGLIAAIAIGTRHQWVEADPTPRNVAPPVSSGTAILVSQGEPENIPASPSLAAIERVFSRAELENRMSQDINVVIFDKSAEAEFRNSDYLYDLLKAGYEVAGLNISQARLYELTQFERSVSETIQRTDVRPRAPANGDGEGTYSVVRLYRPGVEVRRFGTESKDF
jgi:hypothetical protein